MTSIINPKLALRMLQAKTVRLKESPNAFTLVELLVVVAIVGILSAVAIPNFMAQTDKAKATEAKTTLAATLKQAHANYIETGATPETTITKMTEKYGTPANGKTKFDYATTAPKWADPVYTVVATGNSTDSGLSKKALDGCVNFDTGKVDIQSQLDDSTAVDCK